MNIVIGFLGINPKSISFSIHLEKKGINCLFFDEDPDLIHNLNNKIFITEEPDIQMNLIDTIKISACTEVTQVIEKSDFIFSFIDLPSNTDGTIDSSLVFEILKQFYLCSHLDISLYNKNFILSTTLNIGDSKKITENISQFGIKFGYFPNFLKEGEIYKSFINHKSFVLGSNSSELHSEFSNLFSLIENNTNNLILLSLESCEFVKFGISAITASKIAISNMIGDFMNSVGLEKEIPSVMKSISENQNEESKKLFYGLGYGGPHIRQELNSLSEYANNKKVKINLFENIDQSNEEHLEYLKFYFMSLNPNKNVPFIINGLSYKKGVNDIQNSPKYKLCLDFLNEGYNVNIIQNNVVNKNLLKLSESYNGKLKFYKSGTNPEGYKINF